MVIHKEYQIEPGQEFIIDLFRPEDAEGVKNLFLSVYGEGYPIKTYVQPEGLIEENASGRIISSVARTSRGEIVGHNALFSSAPFDRIRESGSGLVLPSYRRSGHIFTQLIAHGEKVGAKKFGIETIFGEPVCNHIYSQKATAALGFTPQAMEIDLMPGEAYDKEGSAQGRVSALLGFKTLKAVPQTVYLPGRYEEALRFLYGGLDDERQFVLSAKDDLSDNASAHIEVQVFDFAKVARLAVHEAGKNFENVFDEQERRLQVKGITVIQVWLKLSWPWIGRIVDGLLGHGYFLGGILPRWFDVDGLLMQKIFVRPNWEGIQLYSERAKEILSTVKEDWVRTER